jgi:hypothetical protein
MKTCPYCWRDNDDTALVCCDCRKPFKSPGTRRSSAPTPEGNRAPPPNPTAPTQQPSPQHPVKSGRLRAYTSLAVATLALAAMLTGVIGRLTGHIRTDSYLSALTPSGALAFLLTLLFGMGRPESARCIVQTLVAHHWLRAIIVFPASLLLFAGAWWCLSGATEAAPDGFPLTRLVRAKLLLVVVMCICLVLGLQCLLLALGRPSAIRRLRRHVGLE